jgi:lipopolysaccharide cholinephosphotransferase
MMLRSEYEKFREIFSQECSDKYILAEPLQEKEFFFKMPKIYKKNTTYVEIPNAGTKQYHMLFVDLFIIENMPDQAWKRNIKGAIYDFAYKGASVCIDYLYPSPVIEKKAKTNPEVAKYYRFRKRLGSFFSHIGGIRFYLRLCDKLARCPKDTKCLGVPSGISYHREIFEKRVFTELGTAMFCGYEVKIPADYDTYLKNLYGDYMQIPPEEKREIHAAYQVKL